MKRLLALLLLAPALLAGCGGPEVKSGVVVNKWYVPDSGYYEYMCYSYNAQSQCTVSMPQWVDIPATYDITLRNCTIKHTGPCPTEDWIFDETTYGKVKVGQHYTIKD